MRMRKKKWAEPELASCPFYYPEPALLRGHWAEAFPERRPMRLELGCGKGSFLAQSALQCRDTNFLGVDMISDMLGVARRQIQSAFDHTGRLVENAALTVFDVTRLELYMGDGDLFERIYINFCNPWFRPKQFKKRLTHPRQLLKYRDILADDGDIWFKTDSELLFAHSLEYFAESGFTVAYQTEDLHHSGFSGSPMTEHEKMYSAEGVKIKFAIAQKRPLPPSQE